MDAQITNLISLEEQRQTNQIGLIPSENAMHPDVAAVLSSCLSTKYSEGYPGKRYYEGNEFVDQIEILAQDRLKQLFGVPYVNVQPYSGSPANLAILMALVEPGATIMGMKLTAGGHLTHGHPKVTASGRFFNSVQYGLDDNARINYDEVRQLAKEHKPKVIFAGTTAYPFIIDWQQFADIAAEVDAYLVADISHISGLVVTGLHPSPVEFAHLVMTTTHKTLRGPRGAVIMATQKGMAKNPRLDKAIDSAIIPGLQGGPHNATTAAIAVAALLAGQPDFRQYAEQIITNAKVLADALQAKGLQLVGGGTDNHLLLLDLSSIKPGIGKQAAVALAAAGIWANANTVPKETASPLFPSGVRLGTPLVTTRGMKEAEMQHIANWIEQVVAYISKPGILPVAAKQTQQVALWQEKVKSDKFLAQIAKEVADLATNFPLFQP